MGNILITGGAGFIGSNLCEKLLNTTDNNIFCLDNSKSTENINELKKNSNFNFIEHDVVNKLSTKIKFDYIYHLACPEMHKYHCGEYLLNTIFTNIIGTKNILDIATKNNSIILFSSTSDVYGQSKIYPQKEDDYGVINPINEGFSESKRMAESLMFEYKKNFNMQIKVVRIFNTYGPKMSANDDRSIPKMIIQSLKNNDITINGSGEQIRSFCYIDDLLDGIIKTMNSSNDFTGPVNLGNPSERTINDLAEKIINLTYSKSKIKYLPPLKNDILRKKPDITLAQRELNWGYRFLHIYKGLKKTIEYYSQIL